MPTCKTCGNKYSLWSARGDGLCKPCGAKNDEDKKQEAERKEAERKQRVLEGAKRNIELILKAMTNEPPLTFTFINRGITTQKSSGLLGVAVGGALFGMAGAMAGNALGGGSSTSFSGEIGVLVVTSTQVLVSFFASPVLSEDGKISSDHLELLFKNLDSQKAERKTFDIRRTQVATRSDVAIKEGSAKSDTVITLGSGSKAFHFQQSDLCVNNILFDVPSASAVYIAIKGLGPLVSPERFISMLEKGESPIPEDQFDELQDGGEYIGHVFGLLLRHSHRDVLAQNLPLLAPNVKASLEQRIRVKGTRVAGAKVKVTVSAALGVAAGVAVAFTEEGMCFLSVLCVIACVISAIVSAVGLRQAMWCRDVLRNESTVVQEYASAK